MKEVVYTGDNQTIDGFSVFLAGPTPKDKSVKSWRSEMIKKLHFSGLKGTIVVPEYKDSKVKHLDYEEQVKWELQRLKNSNVILFWIPRKMTTMPGLTTNIEFGEFMSSEKVVLGFTEKAEHMDYLKLRAKWLGIPTVNTMKEAASLVVKMEELYLYACPKCYGSGFKDSNGRNYRCSKCQGTGLLKPKKSKKKK